MGSSQQRSRKIIQPDTLNPLAEQVATGHIERAEWDDPNDTGRQGSYVRVVHGYRRADPILEMHRRSPRDVTRQHVQSAERLRDDYEIGEGVSGVGRGAGGGGVGPADAQLDALARYRSAVQAVGPGLCAILLPVVLAGWTVARWSGHHGMAPHRAAGLLVGALTRLHDHYNPPVQRGARKLT